MEKESAIRNILFDLGGVILDIDVQATLQRFYDLGFPAKLMNYPHNMATDLFYRFETGKIGIPEFRDEIREISGVDVSDHELDKAWNAMLIRIPVERTRLIERLATRYRLYMLSNTSALHVPVFEEMYERASGIPMEKVFTKIYYSHLIGWHKPDREAWEYVLKDAGIKAQETLFLDDNIHNIKASQELGFRAIHIHERIGLMDLGFDL